MISDSLAKLQSLFARKTFAYNQVFDRKNQYTREVLMDLARFCRAHDSTFNKDDRLHAALEGRREVYLRIQEFLNLSPDEILELHKVKQTLKE